MAEDLEVISAEEQEGGPRKSFLEHLEDLRKALLKCVAVVVVALVLCLFLDTRLAEILEYPIRRMHMLEKPRPTVTFVIGSLRLGPYEVSRDDFSGLPPGDAPHVVFKVGMAKIGEGIEKGQPLLIRENATGEAR